MKRLQQAKGQGQGQMLDVGKRKRGRNQQGNWSDVTGQYCIGCSGLDNSAENSNAMGR
jgi:hypothetical protein